MYRFLPRRNIKVIKKITWDNRLSQITIFIERIKVKRGLKSIILKGLVEILLKEN